MSHQDGRVVLSAWVEPVAVRQAAMEALAQGKQRGMRGT